MWGQSQRIKPHYLVLADCIDTSITWNFRFLERREKLQHVCDWILSEWCGNNAFKRNKRTPKHWGWESGQIMAMSTTVSITLPVPMQSTPMDGSVQKIHPIWKLWCHILHLQLQQKQSVEYRLFGSAQRYNQKSLLPLSYKCSQILFLRTTEKTIFLWVCLCLSFWKLEVMREFDS